MNIASQNKGGRHIAEVAFELCTQQPRVRFGIPEIYRTSLLNQWTMTILKFDVFVAREMAGGAFPFQASSAKISPRTL